MKLLKVQKSLKILTDLKFAILILIIIALTSSIGSFIEQNEVISYYEEKYSKPIYGFINFNFILNLGLDHIYTTWWFLFLLTLLGISLLGCTLTRQFPLFRFSKEYFFKSNKFSFLKLPFAIKIKNIYFLKENILSKIIKMNFYIYQKNNLIYGYKGLIGRVSPILVHFSMILILLGSLIGSFENFKGQEILPKGEIFCIQNPIQVGIVTKIPHINIRVNDFWVEYKKNRIHQFYSNLSIVDNVGNEIKQQTISVNNPLRYKNIDFYQSDWNLLGIRVMNIKENKIFEFPLFQLNKNNKSWITWIKENQKTITIIINEFENRILLYDENGKFLNIKNSGEYILNNFIFLEILPSTGLLIKYDPSIFIIYLGFGLLMITTCLSYLPYTQIWIFNKKRICWIGSSTNRGKIQLEIEFENLIRYLEYLLNKNIFFKKS
jgi:cytochrome c biogenesis protein